jgi:hypothetical protein
VNDLHFLGKLPAPLAIIAAMLAGAVCWWLYRREVLQASAAPARWLPWLRATTVAMIVLMLAEPSLHRRTRLGEPGSITMILDDSQSMSLDDGKPFNRYRRATAAILDADTSLLPRLAEEHEIELVRGGSLPLVPLWSSTVDSQAKLPESTQAWDIDDYRPQTELGNIVDRELSSVLVLLTDGRVNHGLSLLEAIQRKSRGQTPTVFAVSYGPHQATPEVSILSVEHPDRLFRRDLLSGSVVIRDNLAPGENFRLQAWHASELVWEQRLVADGSDQRAIAFSIPIDPLVTRQLAEQPVEADRREPAAIPMELRFDIAMDQEKTSTSSPPRPHTIRFWGALHRSRVLLVDGRSRWESRYLKNMFERDPFWEITAVIAEADDLLGTGLRLPDTKPQAVFPVERDDWMRYDLIILGDLPHSLLTAEQQQGIVDFVSDSGGGLIIIDGQRDSWLSTSNPSLLERLLPVERLASPLLAAPAGNASTPPRVEWTSAGKQLPALDMRQDTSDDASLFWPALPPFQWIARAKPLPGTEVLAAWSLEATTGDDDPGSWPLLATHWVGAGRVLYVATDESWRWRYEVADRLHQRFWNQVARWLMRTPFVAEGDYVSLDAGRMNYMEEQPVEIRCRLRTDRQVPLEGVDVQAIVECDGHPPRVIALAGTPKLPGYYQGTAVNLPPGNYQVSLSAAGVPREQLSISTQFSIQGKPALEVQDRSADIATLSQITEATGGKLLDESELDRLPELLQPFSRGRILDRDVPLWQSYYWFLPLIVLLAIEWWLRKSVGLI